MHVLCVYLCGAAVAAAAACMVFEWCTGATLGSVLGTRAAAALCCAVLCCAVLCCAVLCCAVLCCAVLCCAVLCCAVHASICLPVLCTKSRVGLVATCALY
jgi:hypothetical protein